MADIIKHTDYSAQLKSIISVLQGISAQEQQSAAMPTPQSIEERALQRVLNEDILHQKNIEDVVKGAAKRLAHEELGSQSLSVDEDWLRQFKINVQDISEKEMKMIWSKVLAGEMKKPNSYSRRTLHLLSKLSKEDAAIITKIAPYTLCDDSGNRVIIHDERDEGKFIRFEDLLFLDELGLIETSALLGMNWSFENDSEDYSNCIKLNNSNVGINIYIKLKKYRIPVYTVSLIGKEIFSLIEDVKPNTEYFKSILETIVKDGRCVCGFIKEEGDDSGFVFSEDIFKIDRIVEQFPPRSQS